MIKITLFVVFVVFVVAWFSANAIIRSRRLFWISRKTWVGKKAPTT